MSDDPIRDGQLASYAHTDWIARQPRADCGGCQTLKAQLSEAREQAEMWRDNLALQEDICRSHDATIASRDAQLATLRKRVTELVNKWEHEGFGVESPFIDKSTAATQLADALSPAPQTGGAK